jgi:hypothetical protein
MSPVGGATSLDFFSEIDMKSLRPFFCFAVLRAFAPLRENYSYKPFTTRVIPFLINSNQFSRKGAKTQSSGNGVKN